MRNDYSWDLDLDYIAHADQKKGAHLSKNWDKKKQHNYFVEYYKKNKAKWKKYRENIKAKAREILNPITGDEDQYEMERLREESLKDENNPLKLSTYKDQEHWQSEWRERTRNSEKNEEAYDKAKNHYKNKTLEGRIKNKTTINNIEDKVNKKIDEIKGTKEKRKATKAKSRLKTAIKDNKYYKSKFSAERVSRWEKNYSDALNEYYKTPGGRVENAINKGRDFIKALSGKDTYTFNVNDLDD